MFFGGAIALVLACISVSYAQQGPATPNFVQQYRWRPSVEDIGAFAEARIAALHAGLGLTAEQERDWPTVENSLRDLAKWRSNRLAERLTVKHARNPIERLNFRAEMMIQHSAALKSSLMRSAPSTKASMKRRSAVS